MFVDFRDLEDGSTVEADLCVIGAGAAGITIAHEFRGSDLQVCLVESGGLELDAATQALNQGTTTGIPYPALNATRLRVFGGTTEHWTGWCAPLEELDLRSRPGVPHTGWPLDEAEFAPYYERAAILCELRPTLSEQQLKSMLGLPPVDSKRLDVCFWQRSPPTRFGRIYREELRAPNVKILLHANAVRIETDGAAGLVDHIELRTLAGKGGRVKARCFVLACGGIENARLLLLSNRVEAAGLGNRHDLVGRFFMEHPHVIAGEVIARDKTRIFDLFNIEGRLSKKQERRYRARFCTAAEAQLREGALTCSASFMAQTDTESGAAAAKEVLRQLRRGELPDRFGENVWQIVADLDGLVASAYGRFVESRETVVPLESLSIIAHFEQAPNPDSRVTLSAERDALGLPRAKLDWRFNDVDRRTVRVMTTLIGAELAGRQLGRVRLAEWLRSNAEAPPGHEDASSAVAFHDLGVSRHHYGTTRMAVDPKQGVVDRHCRVHSLRNLYIAGSSIFPTAGRANPTVNLVALTLRLVDHLKRDLA